MPAKSKKSAPPRKRRTAEEARTAILDAAERRLVEVGAAGIRLQEVAADVGVSHPTVLHHFGSREGLVEAVVTRALASLHAGLVSAVRAEPAGEVEVVALLDRVFELLATSGHGRAFMWLALEGRDPKGDQFGLQSVTEAVHELRRARRTGRKKMPPYEDTYFTIALMAMALLAQSVVGNQMFRPAAPHDVARTNARFRAWLARMMIEHFEKD